MGPFLGIPLWLTAVVGTIAFTTWTWFYHRRYVLELSRGIAWDLPVFVYSLFVVIKGVEKAGLSHWVGVGLSPLAPGTSFGAIWLSPSVPTC